MTEDATEENLIEFKCPFCGEANSFRYSEAGTAQECPYCSGTLVVPAENTDTGLVLPLPVKTPRLLLRQIQPEDFADLLDIMVQEELFQGFNWNAPEESELADWLAQARDFHVNKPGQEFRLGIAQAEGGKLIGWAWLNGLDETHRQAWLALVINAKHQRQGFGAEAVRGLLEFGFRGIGLRRICACCDTRNAAGSHTFEKAGMRQEGEFVQDRWVRNEWVDTAYYALLAKEYQP